MRGVRGTNQATGAFELLEGPCCDDTACPVRECWPYPNESREQFVARLTATEKYKTRYTSRIPQEAKQP